MWNLARYYVYLHKFDIRKYNIHRIKHTNNILYTYIKKMHHVIELSTLEFHIMGVFSHTCKTCKKLETSCILLEPWEFGNASKSNNPLLIA